MIDTHQTLTLFIEQIFMRDNNTLRGLGELLHVLCHSLHIGVVQSVIHLVQNEERCLSVGVKGE